MIRLPASAAKSSQRTLRNAEMLVVATGMAILFAVSSVLAEDWPQFRGPNCTGVSRDSKNLPVKFSSTEKVLWSVELGEGISSPVIARRRVFVTSMVDAQKFAVFGLDALTGREIWRQEYDTGPLLDITSPNTQASSTPVTDGERVYVYFSTLGLLAFDAASGKPLWKHPIAKPFYLLGWGAANSPILHEDMVIFNQDDDLSPMLLALDKYTGRLRWRTPRPEMLAGYAVPVVCRAGGRADLVVAGSGKLKGYDPATGNELWTCNTLLRTIMTTPAVHDGVIYISVQSAGDTNRVLKIALLQWKDTNQDGKLSKSEIGKAFWKKFDQGDANRDGFLEDDEIDRAFQAPTNMAGGGNIIQAIKGGGRGDVSKTHVLWNLSNRAPSNIVSPLLLDGRLFVVKKGGISSCFDAATGKTIWKLKRIRNMGTYYASPIAGDGKLYVTGENGFMVVLKQGPRVEVLAKNDLGESCIATPAIAGNRLYVRTLHKLYCFSEETK